MFDRLNEVNVEPVSGLAYRVRPASGASEPAPCLLLLHGVGADEAGFIELARRLDPCLTVILVRGPLTLAPMQYAWFRVAFTPTGPVINAAQAEAARAKLLTFIGQLPQVCGVDPRRIWIAGFSQGGIMSASVGLTAPAAVAGFGILSGRILPEVLPLVERSDALRHVHAFLSHGTEDRTLGVHFVRQAKSLLSELGVAVDYHEYPAGHALNHEMIADFSRWLDGQIALKSGTTVADRAS